MTVVQEKSNGMFEFMVKIDSVSADLTMALVTILITAAGIHLQDPTKPGVAIDS
jgi:hypothetical protein